MGELQDQVAVFQGKVSAGDGAVSALLASQYRTVYEELIPKSRALSERIAEKRAAGEEVGPSWLFQDARYKELIQQADRQVRAYSQYTMAATQAAQAQGFSAGYAEGAKQLLGMGGLDAGGFPAAGVGFMDINAPAINNLVGALQSDPWRDLVKGFPDDLVQDMNSRLVSGLAQGLHPSAIAQSVQRALGVPMVRATRIARTEFLRATNEGLRNSFIDSGVVKRWRWSAALSARTCPACLALNGRTFPLNTPMQRHVQCRCSMSPYLGDGRDQNWQTGEQWLNTQSPSVVRSVLGNDGAFAFSRDFVGLDEWIDVGGDSKWGPSFQAKSWRNVYNGLSAGVKDDLFDMAHIVAPGSAKPQPVPAPKPAPVPAPAPATPTGSAPRQFADFAEVRAWSQTHFKTVDKLLTQDQVHSVTSYGLSQYQYINPYVRYGGDVDALNAYFTKKLYGSRRTYEELKGTSAGRDVDYAVKNVIDAATHVPHLDAAFSAVALPEDVILYRGTKLSNVDKSNLRVGDSIDDDGYLSTSAVRSVAKGFASGTDASVLSITVPAGTPVIPMNEVTGYTTHSHESEFVLPRGTSLRVVAIDVSTSVIHVEAVVPER